MEHDLKISKTIIRKMAEEGSRLTAIYKVIRSQIRFQTIGDYPVISWVIRTVSTIREVTKIEITKTLKIAIDGEFKKISSSSEIVTQLYAQVISENSRETA